MIRSLRGGCSTAAPCPGRFPLPDAALMAHVDLSGQQSDLAGAAHALRARGRQPQAGGARGVQHGLVRRAAQAALAALEPHGVAGPGGCGARLRGRRGRLFVEGEALRDSGSCPGRPGPASRAPRACRGRPAGEHGARQEIRRHERQRGQAQPAGQSVPDGRRPSCSQTKWARKRDRFEASRSSSRSKMMSSGVRALWTKTMSRSSHRSRWVRAMDISG